MASIQIMSRSLHLKLWRQHVELPAPSGTNTSTLQSCTTASSLECELSGCCRYQKLRSQNAACNSRDVSMAI